MAGTVGTVPPGPAAGQNRAARTWPGILAAAVLTCLAAVTVVVSAVFTPAWPLGGAGSPRPVTLSVVVLMVSLVAACWSLVPDRPGSAVGLCLVGVGWLDPGLAATQAPTPQVAAGLLAVPAVAVGGVAVVACRWRPDPAARRAPLVAAVALAFVASGTHVLGYDPFFDPACSRTCASVAAPLASALGPRHALGLSVVLTCAAAFCAVLSIQEAGEAPTSIRAAAAATALLVSAAAAVHWWRWADPDARALSDLLQSLGTAAMTATVLLEAGRIRRVRRGLRGLVQRLGESTTPGGAGASVTAVQFTIPDDGRWVDAAGGLVDTEPRRRCVVLSDHAGPAVRLVLGRWADPRQVVSSITPAGRLALENARLLAAGVVEIAELQESQRRIVEATDRERRRLERDLHDGAQQRLVAVAMHLSSGRRRAGSAAGPSLTAAEADVRQALAALRDLSHDSWAAVLGAEGLAAAIEELVAGLPLQIDVQLSLSGCDLAPPVQTAAYLTAVAGLDNVVRHAGTDRASLTVEADAVGLSLLVTDRGRGGAVIGPGLTDVGDRVGALGGVIMLTSRPGEGTTLSARLPCGS